jgi:cyclophilin family peptidyl-prolyl cis-trans isomerase
VASVPGIPLYKDHQYELVSVYNNTSSANADSMASVFMGLEDPEFVRPTAPAFSKRATALLDSSSIVITTTAGELKAQLFREIAPMASLLVARLVHSGVFNQATATDGKSYLRIAAPITPAVTQMLFAVSDHGGTYERGTVTYCPAEANEISLRVIADPKAPQDSRCTPVARLVEGMDIVDAIVKAPTATSASVKSAAMSR